MRFEERWKTSWLIQSIFSIDIFFSVINIHHVGNKVKMGNRLKNVLTSRLMYIFLLRPFSMRRKEVVSRGCLSSEKRSMSAKHEPNDAIQTEESSAQAKTENQGKNKTHLRY